MPKLFVLIVALTLLGSAIGCGDSEKVKKPKEIQPMQGQSFGAAAEPIGKTPGNKPAAPVK